MELIRVGKVKKVYDAGNELVFEFTDNISVFDKIIPSTVSRKGEILCKTAAFWFSKIGDYGIKNHFKECNGTTMTVKKFRIVNKANKDDSDYLIPLEFITRYYLAGSLYDRIKNGKVNYKDLGYKREPEYGEPLPEPLFEITTKFEEYDRKVELEEAMKIGGLSRGEIEEIKETVMKVDEIIQKEVERRGLIHVDGKKELALGSERELYVVDTFGTMDEDRWWDKKAYEKGEIKQLSKEFVRQYYREIGYYSELVNAREKGIDEPDIPPLPNDMIEKVAKLYEEMYRKITGQSI